LKKKNKRIEKIEIIDIGAKGKAVGKSADGRVVFVENAIPGEIVDVELLRRRRKYYNGKILHYHKLSPDRIEPQCRHFNDCGGCKLQYLSYEKQLFYKAKEVYENIRRLGGVQAKEVLPILPSPQQYAYRNKLEFTFSNRRWLTQQEVESGESFAERDSLGFHVAGRFDRVLDVDECHLMPPFVNDIRNFIREFVKERKWPFYDLKEHTGFLRNLLFRTTSKGQLMVILSFAENKKEWIVELMETLAEKFSEITTLIYFINTKLNDTLYDLDYVVYSGQGYIEEEFDGIRYKIRPKSFFQTNTKQALRLYRRVKELATITKDDIVYDFYTGTGSIALFVAQNAKKVIGVESVPEAIDDANDNAEFNEIKNTSFFVGDIKDIVTEEFFEKQGKPSVIIADPPRVGMHTSVINAILKTKPKRLVYVSCNSATQARDIELLSQKYQLDLVQPVDMFPQTFHVENIAVLSLKKEEF
jgi:23S rRNA (uracil1939-C5)-methyltransferase